MQEPSKRLTKPERAIASLVTIKPLLKLIHSHDRNACHIRDEVVIELKLEAAPEA